MCIRDRCVCVCVLTFEITDYYTFVYWLLITVTNSRKRYGEITVIEHPGSLQFET